MEVGAYPMEFDPAQQIKDLDTGDVVSIEELERKNQEFQNRSQAKSVSQQNRTPADLQFSSFTHQLKQPLFSKPFVQDYLLAHKGNVWCVACSKDGKYVASGGEDGIVSIFRLGQKLTLEVTYHEHTSDVVMLEFSNDGFLLSCSLDSTVRVWHPSQAKSLGVFQHDDAVTSVSFLPTDSSIILTATLGNSVFLWSLRSNEVKRRINFVSPPTATAFSPDSHFVAIGCLNGFCFVYSMPDFRYVTQFIAGPRGKKQTSNEKITSIQFVGNDKFLIASNDSRVRLYSMDNFSVIRKYVGHESKESHLKLSVTSDYQLFMTPSENTGEVFIYPIDHTQYFKSGGFFSSFLKDRSKTANGFKFGKKILINAADFTANSSISKLSVVVGDNCGGVSFIVSA